MNEEELAKRTSFQQNAEYCRPCRNSGWVEYFVKKEGMPEGYAMVIPCVCEKGRSIAAARWPLIADQQLEVAKKAVQKWWVRYFDNAENENTGERI